MAIVGALKGDQCDTSLLIGISAEDIRLLQAGRPMRIRVPILNEQNEPMEVIIFAGETEPGMVQMLYKHGVVTAETKVIGRSDL